MVKVTDMTTAGEAVLGGLEVEAQGAHGQEAVLQEEKAENPTVVQEAGVHLLKENVTMVQEVDPRQEALIMIEDRRKMTEDLLQNRPAIRLFLFHLLISIDFHHFIHPTSILLSQLCVY